MPPADLLSALEDQRLLAIVRGKDPAAALDTVLSLFRYGVGIVEVSLTGADALGVIAQARSALGPEALLGAGTVLTAQQARDAAAAGACFGVTPAVTEAVGACRDLGLPVLAGAVTPTEAVAAMNQGASAVKLFPATLGGPAYLRALRDPLPDVPFVPVGGVDAAAVRAYLAAGALAVGVGSPLVGGAADGRDQGELALRAEQFRAATLGEW
ncbi:bifunctional 4-hydroxy-2-oxoglutarate aldolase/2-dehydro-3-deoxy-phosphogluconate aldolase [Streptomyces sp. NA04227]|uniref:bifunctional 4-hydroxy-2-oxoglutarate aldolase/2-dehydro-3-deoxy-phosphogluconate aldolase n=1 Tax=Streptomyces sp. NA04227 TaxID=2742136 RepID=UPI00158FE92A|nr:bifunctional 4-hydroxy-2-oxoglutarate aldolase/2-dehydro-3-deoxy-phosphogluconate aldolase [Streptomyces sp. NA04227]QKW10292.1 bifunctional 4-hydroxy-2-oxoglutarate aldolase/2-dehydro-3-deoxy-phosphogluconate aldolase [Streptomyces sp. NA04227]